MDPLLKSSKRKPKRLLLWGQAEEPLTVLASFISKCVSSPAHILIITVSVQLDLLSACNFCQRARKHDHHLFDKCSVIAGAFKHDSCVSLTCIKCPRPLTLECYIAKEGSYFIYRSLILFLNICGAFRPGSQSHYAL